MIELEMALPTWRICGAGSDRSTSAMLSAGGNGVLANRFIDKGLRGSIW